MSVSRPVLPFSRRRSVPRRLGAEALALLLGAFLVGAALLLWGPSLLSWGERRAYEADRALLQEAVVAYRAAPPAIRPWPTLSGRVGEPAEGDVEGFQCNVLSDRSEVCPWIDLELLASRGYLPGTDIINSADATLNVSATNAPSGRYGWYLDEEGTVASSPPFSEDVGYP